MDTNEVEILLVEDNPEDVEMTIYALNKIHLANHLVHVRDGVEALEFIFSTGKFAGRVGAKSPKLILLDLKMPKVDGIQVLTKIKSNKATKSIPVVSMTSSKEEQDIIKSYQLGVNSYVVKPIQSDEFVKAVSELGLYWIILNQSPRI
jgi:two-component system response regulator